MKIFQNRNRNVIGFVIFRPRYDNCAASEIYSLTIESLLDTKSLRVLSDVQSKEMKKLKKMEAI